MIYCILIRAPHDIYPQEQNCWCKNACCKCWESLHNQIPWYQMDSKLCGKHHLEYIWNKLSKCVRIISKAGRKLHSVSLITFYYSFAYPYFIYCNHAWGNNYASTSEKNHTALLFHASILLITSDIYSCTIGTFMFRFALIFSRVCL